MGGVVDIDDEGFHFVRFYFVEDKDFLMYFSRPPPFICGGGGVPIIRGSGCPIPDPDSLRSDRGSSQVSGSEV